MKHDLILNLGQLEFDNVPVKGWIIDPDVNGLIYAPSSVVCLSTYYGEIVHTDVMPRGVTVFKDEGRGPEIFFQPFHKDPFGLPYVFFLTIHLVTLVPVDYPIFLNDIIHVPGGPPGNS